LRLSSAGALPAWRPGILTLARLASVWFVLAILAHVLNERAHLTQATARSLAATLRLCGLPAHATDTHVSFPGGSLEIIEECTGLSLVAALLAFTWAVPVSLRQRALGALLLTCVALVWNGARLVLLAFLMRPLPQLIPFLHDVVWQLLTVGVAVLACVLWARAALARSARVSS
jgi:exosortase/archaeosortase family protein